MATDSDRTFSLLQVRLPLTMPGQRIGIMGGSFNPAHEGHAIVAATALKRLRLDQLWWVVTPGNPLKPNAGLPSQAERMTGCLPFSDDPRMHVTGFEADLMAASLKLGRVGRTGEQRRLPYTVEALSFLVKRLPGRHFVWVMGADNLAGFHKWERWRDIADLMPLVVVDRPGWTLPALSSPAATVLQDYRLPEALAGQLAVADPPAWTFLTTRLSQASSTEIRNKIRSISNN